MIRKGYYAIYQGIEYHWTENMNTGKMKIFTHDIQKTDNTFNQCNQYGEQKCYEKYVEPFELDSVYSINTFAIVNGNERIGIEKESEEMYFVFVSSNNNELIERYQLKPIERGKTYEGWINKEDVCLMEERSEIHI